MKHLTSRVLATLLFMATAIPTIGAATVRAYDRTYYDGSSDSGTVRQERIRQYRQQSSDMQQKINALGSVANPSVYMPILFGVGIKDISPNFGDPRSGGRTHEGEDIMAVKGTPIVSPTPAVVLRAGDNGGTEGIYVYTANPGSETFIYYHLDRVGEGVVPGLVLSQGSLIGYVGNTGNASGGPAHLHFEIHNSSGAPTDPFPRLTGEFSIQEKINYLGGILRQVIDQNALARFLVTNFRGSFIAASGAGIDLPAPIIDALASIPASAAPVSGSSLPAGDLDIGSSGSAVITLQKYLITASTNGAAARLSSTGATGYFGLITKSALVEFQVSVGISPASGYYGATTRTFVESHPIGVSPSPTPAPSPAGIAITRNLSLGSVGEDVRVLQQLLNAKQFTIAATGSGSPGNETNYFGPATQSAVIRFQVARSISPSTGYVGPLTRAALAAL